VSAAQDPTWLTKLGGKERSEGDMMDVAFSASDVTFSAFTFSASDARPVRPAAFPAIDGALQMHQNTSKCITIFDIYIALLRK
jgi:hypothetical protein